MLFRTYNLRTGLSQIVAAIVEDGVEFQTCPRVAGNICIRLEIWIRLKLKVLTIKLYSVM
nr:hypothetical protein [Escherichia coli]